MGFTCHPQGGTSIEQPKFENQVAALSTGIQQIPRFVVF